MRTIIVALVSAFTLAGAVAHAQEVEAPIKTKTKTPKVSVLLMEGKKAPKKVKASELTGKKAKALQAATKGFSALPDNQQPEALTCTLTAGGGLVYGWCHDGETFCYAGCTSEGCTAGCAACDGNC